MFQTDSRSNLSNSGTAKNKLFRRLPTFAITLFASAAVVRALVSAEADAAANSQAVQAEFNTVPTVVARAVGDSLDEATTLQSLQLAQATVIETSTSSVYDDEMLLARTRELMDVDNREVDEVAARLKEIIRARYEADQLNTQSMATIDELRRQIAEFEALLQQADDRHSQLNADKAALEEKLSLVVNERDSALDNLGALDSQIQQQLGSVQALQSETETAGQVLAEKEQQIADLNAQIQQLADEKAAALADSANAQDGLTNNLAELESQLADVVAEKNGVSDDLSNTRQALEVSQQALAEGQKDLEAHQQALAESQKDLEVHQQALADSKQALEDNQNALAVTRESLARTEDELVQSRAMLDEKEGALDQLNGLVAEKQGSLGLFEQQLGNNQRAIDDLKGQVNTLARERDVAKAEVQDVERMLEEKADELAALEDQLNQLGDERDNAVVQINELQSQLAETTSRANSFLSERDNLAGELSLFENKAADVGNSFVAEQQAHTQTKTNLFALQREADDMRRALDRLTSEHDALQKDTTQLKATRAGLNGQLLAMKDEMSTRQKELQAALSSIANLNKTIADLTSERDGLLVQTDQLGAEVVALKDSMSASENDYANELASSRQQFLDQTRALESEVATRDQNLELLKDQLATVNTEFEGTTAQAADEMAARDQMIATLKDQVAELETSRDQLRLTKQNNAEEIAKLLGDIDELTENRASSIEKIDQLNLMNEELQAGVISSTNAMEALKADGADQLARLKGDIRDLSNTRDDYAAKIAQLESMNQELADKLKLNREKLALVTAESGEKLDLVNATLARFQSRESLYKSNALEAADKLQELVNNNQELTAELDKARGQFARAEADLGSANTEIGVFEAELNIANQKLRDLMNAQQQAEAERDRIAAEAETLRVSLTEELNDAMLENIVVQNARADNSIPLMLGAADFFETGSARLTKEGGKNLTKLAEIIRTYHNRRIVVEGHTDSVPIGPGLQYRYASNWELSVARAAAAVRHMQKETDIDPQSMSAAGYGEFKPVADNSTEEGRQQNRRVEVVLYPSNAEIQNVTALDE